MQLKLKEMTVISSAYTNQWLLGVFTCTGCVIDIDKLFKYQAVSSIIKKTDCRQFKAESERHVARAISIHE
jgi:hypothetical protein